MTLKLLFVPLLALSLHGAAPLPSLSTQDIGAILEGKQTYGDRQANCTRAYDDLIEKIGDPTNEVGLARLAHPDRRDKFIAHVSMLTRFVGWSSFAQAANAHTSASFAQCTSLMEIARRYCGTSAILRNLDVAQARIMRLGLENKMLNAGKTYEQADPDSTLRKSMYDLLRSVTKGVKVRLIEMAELISICGYSPTGNTRQDLELADSFMNQYLQAKASPNHKANVIPSQECFSPSKHSPKAKAFGVPDLRTLSDASSESRARARKVHRDIKLKLIGLAQASSGVEQFDDAADVVLDAPIDAALSVPVPVPVEFIDIDVDVHAPAIEGEDSRKRHLSISDSDSSDGELPLLQQRLPPKRLCPAASVQPASSSSSRPIAPELVWPDLANSSPVSIAPLMSVADAQTMQIKKLLDAGGRYMDIANEVKCSFSTVRSLASPRSIAWASANKCDIGNTFFKPKRS